MHTSAQWHMLDIFLSTMASEAIVGGKEIGWLIA